MPNSLKDLVDEQVSQRGYVSSTLDQVDWNAQLVRGDLGRAVIDDYLHPQLSVIEHNRRGHRRDCNGQQIGERMSSCGNFTPVFIHRLVKYPTSRISDT